MSTSHLRDGPDSILLSGPLPGLHISKVGKAGCAAIFANDNRTPRLFSRPANAQAVLLCQEQDADGVPMVTIRLWMTKAESCPLLYSTREQQDVIALWHSAGQQLNLPLALCDAMGRVSRVTHAPGELSFMRRGGSALSGRRPRVMRRRQPPLKAFVFKNKTKKA